ncbi:MAG: response regulator transcription factor [Gemmatimonadota bacterium]
MLVADDHEIFRKRVIRAVAESFPGTEADEAGDGCTALALLDKGRYDLVLLDISMPGRSGLEVLKEIRSRRHATRVLVLSMHPEEEYAARALRAGASGYVAKEKAAEELVGAIRAVLAGGVYVSASADRRRVTRKSGPIANRRTASIDRKEETRR